MSVIPECDWKEVEHDHYQQVRGRFVADWTHKLKRWIGIVFFMVAMPGFGLWYIHHLYKTSLSAGGMIAWLGITVCAAAPFVFGKALWKIKWTGYTFTDSGIEDDAGLSLARWDSVQRIKEARLGYHHMIRIELDCGDPLTIHVYRPIKIAAEQAVRGNAG